ncbi:uncharacterized protein LOC142228443 [Haematobia irritans]|uniref:uncharacterized protein LOC142228443 n=1 Tax=Haematobia irritans TaxID=7368 RepID=UPI003F50AD73
MDTTTTNTTTTTAVAESTSNLQQLCRICISSNINCNTQMISIFGEDSLWRKITTLANVQIEPGDILPQQICISCAKNTISACLFKKKCEDADNFFRQQLFLGKLARKTANTQDTQDSEAEEILPNGQNHRTDDDDDEDDDAISEHSDKRYHRQLNGDHSATEEYRQDDNRTHDDQFEDDLGHLESNGLKALNNSQKQPAFDFNSIRLMHEYMQQQLSKFNGLQSQQADMAGSDDEGGGDNGASGTDTDQDDEEHLPLIPEIELITPSDEGGPGTNGGLATDGSAEAGATAMTQMRGYQCPHCFQIFEMRQVLKAHMQSVHGTAGPVYECTNCKKTYFYKRFLEKHIRRGRCVKKRRNQTRPMQCSDCNVLFPTGHHLGWHKRTGCPSKTAKMPLQQLFKQNIVQYNNFPRRIGIRKPENALYLHNRKLMMSNNKRKGRTRIKLDARKIALAKQLILREATTTVIANELNISRTFAWRLRKSLVNGVSLHERVIDPPEEDEDNNEYADNATATAVIEENAEETTETVHKTNNFLNHHPFTEHIKSENADTEDDEVENNHADIDDHEELRDQQQQLLREGQIHMRMLQEQSVQAMRNNNNLAVATSVIQRATTSTTKTANENQHQQQQLQLQQQQAIEQKFHNTISVVQQQRLMDLNANKEYTQRGHHQQQVANSAVVLNNVDADDDEEDGTESREEDSEIHDDHHYLRQQQETECGVNSHEQQQQQQLEQTYLKNNLNSLTHTDDRESHQKLSLISQLSPAVAAAINQLPVNLSIRPISSMQNNETTSNEATNAKKKPRKPNVFIDDEKYAMAKMLVGQNASTMEIAKALNVSQMTAWKVRDAIIKGVPLSYRNRRDMRMTMTKQQDEEAAGGMSEEGSEGGSRRETENERQQQALLVKQQLEHQQKLQQQHLQQQQQIQELLQRQQQLQQQQQQLEQQKQQRLQQQQLEEQKQQQMLLKQQQKRQQDHKLPNPRRRLKAAERELRDKEITREILELIKEDSNIQYWKVSARLAEKGYAISPSSVCQKLKSMGIHRRWKPGDKPPLIDMEHLKAAAGTSNAAAAAVNNSIAVATLAAAAANAQNASSSADESYEQFDMGGGHFLSAFTR